MKKERFRSYDTPDYWVPSVDVNSRQRPDSRPNPDSVMTVGNYRICVLTERIVRIEYSSTGNFEDRPSLAFLHRNLPKPVFELVRDDNIIQISTDFFICRVNGEKSYRQNGVDITYLGNVLPKNENESGDLRQWISPGEEADNLLGTFRTLDGKIGAYNTIDQPLEIEKGLFSRSGWSVIDDSTSPLFETSESDFWPAARPEENQSASYADVYYFAFGTDFYRGLAEFTRISGPIGFLPRWALGNWWSRYWPYTHDTHLELMDSFKERGIPLSHAVLDMDWHITSHPAVPGKYLWTAYSWNRELIPDPAEFLAVLNQKYSLAVSLNLHPQQGVHPFEDMYDEMVAEMGLEDDLISEEAKLPIQFDITDKKFAHHYFKHLHHPKEDIGVDLWWMDWQQGTKSNVEGLDPLFMLNHLHFLDLGRNPAKRSMTFSRWGGLGNHRYPIGFSGDSLISWKSLAVQPYFTSISANVGYTWWSHDIGGHMWGKEDPILILNQCFDQCIGIFLRTNWRINLRTSTC